ncbi:DUF2461 domain-containing protein [Ulvibacterium sp.]|uniref:DUF2461 domain-containing protein n=1 Tax=Ulvibacterium sp. TaxID=2665914 RepID=UPI002634BBAA|nr:DUF2461 domain-containing protein [Ulvibacterium sp.]
MSGKEYIFKFLQDLTENNSKDWMEANKERYNQSKTYWLKEVESMLKRLSKHDKHFEKFSPKDTIMRINNNRMFHPDLPIYKNHFAFSPMTKKDGYARLFFSFSPFESYIGGGLWRPQKEILDEVRAAIVYEGEILHDAINDDAFMSFFGGLQEDTQKLKKPPRGYDKNHEYVELLKYKNFSTGIHPTKEYLIKNDLADVAEEVYLKLKPMNDFFQRALFE